MYHKKIGVAVKLLKKYLLNFSNMNSISKQRLFLYFPLIEALNRITYLNCREILIKLFFHNK